MPTTLSYVGVAGLCAACLRANVDNDKNFCEKKIRNERCDLSKVN